MRTDTAVVVWVATVGHGVHPNRAEATAVRGARALGRVGLAARRVLLASCSLRSRSRAHTNEDLEVRREVILSAVPMR